MDDCHTVALLCFCFDFMYYVDEGSMSVLQPGLAIEHVLNVYFLFLVLQAYMRFC